MRAQARNVELTALLECLFLNEKIDKAIEKPNYIKINGKIFVEDESLNYNLKKIGMKRNLTSGLAIIKNEGEKLIAGADSRRDGTVRGN